MASTTFKGITKEQIKAWKEKHCKVTRIDIPLDPEDFMNQGEEASFVICAPNRKLRRALGKYAENTKKAESMLMANCVLGGDMKFLSEDSGDDDVYYSVIEAIGELVKSTKAKAKKL